MAENSTPWTGGVGGDDGPYSDQDWAHIWELLFTGDQRASQGPLRAYLNELAVSGATSPVTIATGAGIVDGEFYENNSAATLAIPTPAVSTRIDRVVLSKDFTAQTVRIKRVAGAEGGGAPALVQNDGVEWQIPLAQASITTGGAITLTDQRVFCVFSSGDVTGSGIVSYYNGITAPVGYSILAAARGFLICGLVAGGTLGGSVGAAFTDLLNRTHTHTGPSHTHASNTGSATTTGQTQNVWAPDNVNSQIGSNASGGASSGVRIFSGVQADGTGVSGTAATGDVISYIQYLCVLRS